MKTCTGAAWTSAAAQFDSVIGIDRTAWRDEVTLHGQLFEQLAYHLPKPLVATKARLAARLDA